MLYHYTTIEALFSIIEQIRTETDIDECGRRNEHWVLPLRATHIGFLNDSTEGNLLPSKGKYDGPKQGVRELIEV